MNIINKKLKIKRRKASQNFQNIATYLNHILIIFGSLLLPCLFPIMNKVHAQSLSLSISPPILEIMIKPGKSVTQTYKLKNLGETTIITPRLVEFGAQGVRDDKDFQKDAWINLITNNAIPERKQIVFDKPFLLEKGEERQMLLKVNPPKNIEEKDYYRVLLFSTQTTLPLDTSQSSLSQNIGSILLVNVTSTGLIQLKAEITRFKLPKVIDSFGPLKILVEVKNTGKTYFRPREGKINLTGPIGKGSYEITPNVILVDQSRILLVNVSTSKKAGFSANQPEETLSLGGFFIGKYSVGTSFNIGGSNIKIEQEKTFYAIPWKATLFLLGIFLMIKHLKKLKSRFKKKKASKQ